MGSLSDTSITHQLDTAFARQGENPAAPVGRAADFFALLKPRVMTLVVFTGLAGLVVAPGDIHPVLAFTALLCIAVGAGAAGCLNMWYDADIDAIIPYGCGVPALDSLEAKALERVFGASIGAKPIITLAPSIGATVAGFGTIDVAVATKCLTEQRLPARLNSASTGSLAAAAAPSESRALRNILVCTPSLGGQNSAAVISRANS